MLTLLAAKLGAAAVAASSFLPGINIMFWLRCISYVIIVGFGLAGGVKFSNWLHKDKLTPREAKAQCNTSILMATHIARENALRRREQSIISREASVASDESHLAALAKKLEDATNAPKSQASSDTVCIGSDDEWLQQLTKGGAKARSSR